MSGHSVSEIARGRIEAVARHLEHSGKARTELVSKTNKSVDGAQLQSVPAHVKQVIAEIRNAVARNEALSPELYADFSW
jgi:hypothetical protein